jgi:hypothetical protein
MNIKKFLILNLIMNKGSGWDLQIMKDKYVEYKEYVDKKTFRNFNYITSFIIIYVIITIISNIFKLVKKLLLKSQTGNQQPSLQVISSLIPTSPMSPLPIDSIETKPITPTVTIPDKKEDLKSNHISNNTNTNNINFTMAPVSAAA